MKNPCNHPGDIRRLKAVSHKELNHLVNVVVFPSKGQRPEQNKMSGGDLDGDVYMVIWDKDLMEGFKESEPANNSHKSVLAKTQVKDDRDEVNFLKYFYENDYLGRLATTWTAYVNIPSFDKDGPNKPMSIKMSEYLCKLVDFAKHGEGIT